MGSMIQTQMMKNNVGLCEKVNLADQVGLEKVVCSRVTEENRALLGHASENHAWKGRYGEPWADWIELFEGVGGALKCCVDLAEMSLEIFTDSPQPVEISRLEAVGG